MTTVIDESPASPDGVLLCSVEDLTVPDNDVTTLRRPTRAAAIGFHHLLVCLDRSATAEAVLPLVAHLAHSHGARVTLLHVLEPPSDPGGLRATDALGWEIVRQEAQAYLDSLAQRLRDDDIQIQVHLSEGRAAPRVAALTDELDVDLLVLSAYGESGPTAWRLGDTARKILATANGSVLVVPAHDPGRIPGVPPRRVLVPLDGSARSECVLTTALQIARADAAEVILAHVVADPVRTELLFEPEDLDLARKVADRLMSRVTRYLDRQRQLLVAGGVRASVAVGRAEDHRQGLLALAATQRADLIVLSAHGSVCNPRHRFGSVTAYVLAHSTVPVLMVQDLRESATSATMNWQSRLPPRSVDAAIGGA